MQAEAKGTIELDKFTLKDVAYLPELTKNLLSVSAITKSGGEVKFSGDKVEVSRNDLNVFEGRKTENGLFSVKLINYNTFEKNTYLVESIDVHLWHRKLAHLGENNLKILSKISEGMNVTGKGFHDLSKHAKFA